MEKPEAFGLVIAYVLPGFVVLWMVATFDPIVAGWLAAAPATTVGGFLFALLASLALGLALSGARSIVERLVEKATRSSAPRLDHTQRREHEAAYRDLRDQHYRHYQAHGNLAIAAIVVAAVRFGAHGWPGWGWALGAVAGIGILAWNAQEQLRIYRRKTANLIGPRSTLAA